MKYRACYSRYHNQGIVIPVPDNHQLGKHMFIHKFCGRNIMGYEHYNLFSTPEKAEDYIRAMMQNQDNDEKRRYKCGDARPRTKIYAYDLKSSDGKVVERFIRKMQTSGGD